MSIIFILLPLALALSATFLISFLICVRNGQFDDLDTPAYILLLPEDKSTPKG